MKYLLLPLLCLLAVLTGCSTVTSRIEEKSALFNTLDAQTQERLKRSAVKVGDTQDMVYIAFGRPDRIKETATAKGQSLTWIYNTYRSEYEGTHFAGYRRHGYFDQRTKVWRVYYEPVHVDMYSERVEEYMRVIFHDDKVVAIEQQTPR
jgi:outer membrane protein assembly factor BamE (lipoprotein component of BamABCDE complex)